MINEAFNKIVRVVNKFEMLSVVEFAEVMEEADYDKDQAIKDILHLAFIQGIRTEAYEQIRDIHNEYAKAVYHQAAK